MNYEDLTFEDIHRLVWEDEEKFDQIPIVYLRKIIKDEWIRRNTVRIDDSSIMVYNIS